MTKLESFDVKSIVVNNNKYYSITDFNKEIGVTDNGIIEYFKLHYSEYISKFIFIIDIEEEGAIVTHLFMNLDILTNYNLDNLTERGSYILSRFLIMENEENVKMREQMNDVISNLEKYKKLVTYLHNQVDMVNHIMFKSDLSEVYKMKLYKSSEEEMTDKLAYFNVI